MNINTLVSVVVPVYNVEKYITRCIESIINQSYRNIEIILIDDGSTDHSGIICDKYAYVDKRIKVVHKENAGLGMARNSGLSLARGKFLIFIDSDDYIGKNRIECMLDCMEQNKADTCMTGYTKEYSKNNKVKHLHVYAGKIFLHDKILNDILPKMCGTTGSSNDFIEMSVCMVMFSNKLIQEHSLQFESERNLISEDLVYDFEYYPLAKKICVTNTSDYFYCDNEESLTTKYRSNRFQDQIILYNTILNKACKLGIDADCKPRLQNTLLAIARYSIKLEEKYSKINGKKIARTHILDICYSMDLQIIFSEIDTKELRMPSKIVNYFIRNRMVTLLILIMKMKNIFNV